MSGHVYLVYKLLRYLRHRERRIRPALINNHFSGVSTDTIIKKFHPNINTRKRRREKDRFFRVTRGLKNKDVREVQWGGGGEVYYTHKDYLQERVVIF